MIEVKVSKAFSPMPAPQRVRQASPEFFNDLVGRHDEVEAVLSALHAGSFVNVWGECGTGKTSLLRHVAYRATEEFYDWTVIYRSAARQPLEDFLHELHRCLYKAPAHAKWRAGELREQLGSVQAVLVIDDMALADSDLADLLWVLRGSLVVIASTVRRSDPALRPIWLGGLKEDAAIELFQRGLGHRLETGEYADVRRLIGPDLSRGHPLRVLQAAALVRSGRRSTGELVRILQSGDLAERFGQECRSALSPEERQVVAVLALAAGTFLPADLISRMCGLSQIVALLRALRRKHVIDERPDRFGLPVCSIGAPRALVVPSARLGLSLRGLDTWLTHPDLSFDGLLSVSGSVLAILDFADQAGEWDSVLRIVRAIEPALIISGRWEQWRSALNSGLHAAEQLHHDLERAYYLHQLGSRALCLGDQDQAIQLLKAAESLRPRRNARKARRVTTHNLTMITRRQWWHRPATIAAAAAAAVVISGVAIASNLPTPSPPPTSPSPSISPTVSRSPSASPFPTESSSPANSSTTPAHITTSVSRVSPASGTPAGGDIVTITGSGFTGATGVNFGSTSATSFQVNSDSQITVTSPAYKSTPHITTAPTASTSPTNAVTVDIIVVTPAGTSATSSADQFTYVVSVVP